MKHTLVAIVAGLALGALLLAFQGPSYAFLPEAKVVAHQSGRFPNGVRMHATRFVAGERSTDVLSRVRAAFPYRIEQKASNSDAS